MHLRAKKLFTTAKKYSRMVVSNDTNEEKLMSDSIFLEADNRGIAVYEGPGNRVDWARDVLSLSNVVENWDLYDRDNVFFTSSMDFANEYGFKTADGARKLLKEATRIFLNRAVSEGMI